MIRLFTAVALVLGAGLPALAQSRVAEITRVEGVRDNHVRGLGLVIGLNGTGDKSAVAKRMVANMIRRESVNVEESELGEGNFAVVLVTAKLDPFRRPGSRVDVTVSSTGNAKSLRGGYLVQTPLKGPYGKEVYALAEGSLVVGGLAAEGDSGSSVTINVPTVGKIPSGALMEKEVPMAITDRRGVVRLLLQNQNWRTATNLEKAVNERFPGSAKAIDAGTVELKVPASHEGRVSHFLAEVNDVRVAVDMISKVVVDERQGVIVAGGDVRVSTVAVSFGKLSVTISENPEVVPSAPFTEGPSATVVPRSQVEVVEDNSGLRVVEGGETIARLAQSLEALGASPRQLISILQQIKAAGALHAELEVH